MTKQITNQWNATEYDPKHEFVYKKTKGLVELLAPMAGEPVQAAGAGDKAQGQPAGQLSDQELRERMKASYATRGEELYRAETCRPVRIIH